MIKSEIDFKDIYKIRQDNLKILCERYGSQNEVAELLELSKAYLSQLLSDNISKVVSDKTARYIEERLSLQCSWMDNDHQLLEKYNKDRFVQVYTFQNVLERHSHKSHEKIVISINELYSYDFALKIDSRNSSGLFPTGTILLMLDTKEKRNLSNTNIVLARKKSEAVLGMIDSTNNDKLIIEISTFNEIMLNDLDLEIEAKLVLSIYDHKYNINKENLNKQYELYYHEK